MQEVKHSPIVRPFTMKSRDVNTLIYLLIDTGTPARSAGDYFKITSTTAATLTFTPALAGDPTSVSATSFAWVFQASGTYRVLTTSAPVQVYMYATSMSSTETFGDPSVTLVPPVNQYYPAYQFSTFSGLYAYALTPDRHCSLHTQQTKTIQI